ncbi:MAG: fibronectin type III domain-containing protein, partial [Bacteroidales bacterium]
MKQNLLTSLFGFVLLAFICLMTPDTIQAQIYAPEGLNMPGTWNGWTNPPTNNLALASSTQVAGGRVTKITTGTTRWQTIFSVAASGADLVGGTYSWAFTSGSLGNPWGNKWVGTTVTMNTLQSYTYNSGPDNSTTLTNGKWYTMNWKDSGYAGTSAIFMETSAAPVTISSVVQNPLDGDVISNEAVTITVTTSAAPAVDEKLFVLYSINNWSTHAVVELAFTGTTGTAEIPGQTTNTNIDYRIISTSISLLSAQSVEYYWMRSIKYSIDYTYNVDPLPAPSAVTLTAPANAAIGIFPTIAFDWEPEATSNTYDLQVATQSDFLGGIVLDLQSIVTTSYNKTLPYGNQYYWRVRGENGSGKGTWSSTYSFTTSAAKTTLTGNGGGGFGGPVGGSVLKIGDDGTNILFHFTKGTGDLNDVLVLYISNGSTGRSMIDGEVNDQGDDLRRAISSAGDNASELYFPIGFEVTHAIAINTGFGGLWSIPATGAVGNNGLAYVNSVNSTLSTAGQTDFYFNISFGNLGLDAADPFSILGIYLNGGNGYTSNEGYGFTAATNIGTDNLAFTSYFNF